MEGSHSLERMVNDVARDIQDPETGLSVWKRRQLAEIHEAKSAEDRSELRQRKDMRMGALGSGTDYTAFVDHLGIAGLNLGFEGETPQGIYHSIYDDFYWYTHFSDTEFVYGRALAQTVGTAVLRMANAEVLPYEFGNLADTVQKYNKELQKLLKDKQDEIKEQNQQLEDGAYKAADDPRKPTVPPKRKDVPPYLNFAPLQNSADTLTRSAERYEKAFAAAQAKVSNEANAALLNDLNNQLIETERALINDAGLPRRSWYKHLLYAPGVYTGYQPKTVPGVREGIEQDRYSEAEQEIVRVSKALQDESAILDKATGILESLK